ncbi:hypothetical protein AGMMS49982_03210 [Bacteroidia bacterium]|nr:hypothetical protein AGMMS49982_03210 [Bacteroidia bacterium]
MAQVETETLYWVLWIPTYTHKNFEQHIVNKSVETDISDNKNYPQPLKVELIGKDIELTLSEITTNKSYFKKVTTTIAEHKLKLKYVDNSCNGLFVYECLRETDNKITLDLSQKPRHSIVHAIKELYHRHISHGHPTRENKDYYFKVFVSEVCPDIKSKNNDAIKFYLTEFESKYKTTAEHFEEWLHSYKNNGSNHVWHKLAKWVYDYYSKSEIYEESKNTIIETLYTSTLCQSKYLDSRNNDIRRMLLNIDNLKTFFYFTRDYHRYLVDDSSNRRSLKWTRNGVYISIVLGIFGLFYTYYSNKNTEIQTKNNQDEVILKLQQQQNRIDSVFNVIQTELTQKDTTHTVKTKSK